jgi:hypothetical protein
MIRKLILICFEVNVFGRCNTNCICVHIYNLFTIFIEFVCPLAIRSNLSKTSLRLHRDEIII